MIEYRGGCKGEKKYVYIYTRTNVYGLRTFKSCVGESVCIVGTDSIMYVPQGERDFYTSYIFLYIIKSC